MYRILVVGALAFATLAACMADAPDPDDPMGRTPAALEAERLACRAVGGDFRKVGLGILTCIRPTTDGGTLCTSASDCEGICLATPGKAGASCAAQTPVFGCFTMLDDSGERVDICAD